MKYIAGLIVISIVVYFTMFPLSDNKHVDHTESDFLYEKEHSDIDIANEIRTLIYTTDSGIANRNDNIFEEYNSIKSSISFNRARTEEEDWVDRGPGNVGGRMRTLIVDKNDVSGDTWIAGSASGGVWKTINSGTSWSNLTPSLSFLSFVSLAQAESNPDVIYAGTGEGALGGNFMNGVGIFKSIDGGDTWNLLESTSGANSQNFKNTNRIIVDPTNENIVLAATSNGVNGQSFISGVQKSTDGGITWNEIYTANSLVQQIIASPDDFNRIYLTLIQQGVFVSDDGGNTFEQSDLADVVQSSGGDVERTELAISPSNTNVLYASCSYINRSGSGLFVSVNGGVNWTFVDDEVNGLDDYLEQGEYDNCIAINPFNEKEVFWGGVELYTAVVDLDQTKNTGRGFLSLLEIDTDEFLDFITFNNATNAGGRLAINDPSNTPSLEIRFGNGFSQKAHRFTVPSGSTAGVPDADYSYQDYVEVPFEVWDIDENRQLMISFRDQENNGEFNLNFREEADESLAANREYVYIHSLEYDANSPSPQISVNGGQEIEQYLFMWPTLAEGAEWPTSVLESTLRINFGETFFQVSDIQPLSSNVHPDHHFLATINTGVNSFRLITSNDGGVAYSDDKGQSFITVELGLNTSQFYSATKRPGAEIYFGGTQDNGVLLSPSGSSSLAAYQEKNAGVFADGFEVVWSQINPNIVIASNQRNNIFKSTDGGQTFSFARSGLDDSGFSNTSAPFFTKLANNPSSRKLYAVSTNGIWESDMASEWSLIDMTSFSGWGGFLDIEVSPINRNIIWAGGGMSDSRDIFLSTDGGENFGAVSKYSESIGNITTIVPDPNNENGAYLLFSQSGSPKILKTTNLGESWTDLTQFEDGVSLNGFPNVGTFSLLVFPDGDRMWVGTELGIVESLDGGATWALYDGNIPNVLIWDFKVVDGEVIAATYGRGIWTIDLGLEYPNWSEVITSVSAVDTDLAIYPNPAKDKVSISASGATYKGDLRIFSNSGKLIREEKVVNGELVIADLPKGIYFLKGTDFGKAFSIRLVKE